MEELDAGRSFFITFLRRDLVEWGNSGTMSLRVILRLIGRSKRKKLQHFIGGQLKRFPSKVRVKLVAPSTPFVKYGMCRKMNKLRMLCRWFAVEIRMDDAIDSLKDHYKRLFGSIF